MSEDAAASSEATTRPGSGSAKPPATRAREDQYIVVARRYRPRSFNELVGQRHVAQALINAINTHRVGHAYLFCGARGVGKTSTARILAKALNAPDGPTPYPDNEDDMCQRIDSGDDVDVLEIDGASNRGIEEIRQLRSNVNVRPSRARFKIYIIDEVHMLTTPAFNALLKTLEEPPEHVKFIFCTTDPDKIPVTVLSRCQRFDFAPVELPEIVDRLQTIVTAERREAEPEALRLLARRAAGSMRDSQSLLEQLLSYSPGPIRLDDVHQMLGTAKIGRLCALVDQLIDRNAAAALEQLDLAAREGVDLGQLGEQLVAYFRDLMTVAVGGGADLLLLAGPSDFDALQQQADQLGLETTLAILQIVDQTVTRLRQSGHVRTLIEMALVRICHLENLVETAELIAQLQSGAASEAAPAARPSRSSAPARPAERASPAATQKKKENLAADPERPPDQLSDAPPLDPRHIETAWKQAIATLEDMTREMVSQYERLAICAPNRLVVSFRQGYILHKESCERPDRKARIEEALSRAAGRPMRVDLEVIPEQEPPPGPGPAPRTRRQRMRDKERHPLVRRAVDLFDAEVIRVEDGPARPN